MNTFTSLIWMCVGIVWAAKDFISGTILKEWFGLC